MITDKNKERCIYGKILCSFLYKKDEFNIYDTIEYKNICKMLEINEKTVENNEEESSDEEDCAEEAKDINFIQQALRELKDESNKRSLKFDIWMKMGQIIKNSTVKACERFSKEIVDLFMDDNMYLFEMKRSKISAYKKYNERFILENKQIYKAINILEDKNAVIINDIIEKNKKPSCIRVKTLGLCQMLIELYYKRCFISLRSILNEIFIAHKSFSSNEFKFYLIDCVIFLVIEIGQDEFRYELYAYLVKKMENLSMCKINQQCFDKIKELYDVLKLL